VNLLLDRYERATPVQQFPPNGYGLYDMAGNGWECTEFCTPRHPDEMGHPYYSPQNPRMTSPEHSSDPDASGADISPAG
jgi:formylglycine-generating enzyme required for sulfatase activity